MRGALPMVQQYVSPSTRTLMERPRSSERGFVIIMSVYVADPAASVVKLEIVMSVSAAPIVDEQSFAPKAG